MIVPFRMTVCGIDELHRHRVAGVSHVLSILDPDWPVPGALDSYGEHHRLELRFHDVIEEGLPGMVTPHETDVAELLGFGRRMMAAAEPAAHLLVHCHAGVSRSTASMTLMLAQAQTQVPASDILGEVLRIRPQAWPNLRIIEIGDGLLQRNGELVEAVHTLYRAQLAARPGLEQELRDGGRAREVEGAKARRPAL